MKKITVLLLTLFSLAAMAAQADDYIPLVEQGKVWKYAGHISYYEYLDAYGNGIYWKDYFLPIEVRIEGTKEIEGQEYAACQVYFEEKAVPAPNSPNFFLREDVNERKVWVVYNPDNLDLGYVDPDKPNKHYHFEIGLYSWSDKNAEYLLYDFSESPDYSFWDQFYYPWPENRSYLEGVGIIIICQHESHDFLNIYENADEATFLAGVNILLKTCDPCDDGPIPLLYEVADKDGNVIYYDDRFASLPGKIMDSNGLEKIVADDSPAVYYDLQGYKVDSPEPGQTVIRVRGDHADKIVIK